MKKIISILIFTSLTIQAWSQCFPDRHSTEWFNSWVSCEKTISPNVERDSSHWIMYDFGTELKMYDLKIWNINSPDYLDYGIKTAIIDYSSDGINWTEYGEVELLEGSGKNNDEGQDLLNFNGEIAKYLLITAKTSFGSNCAGFSELRLDVDSLKIIPTDTTGVVPVDSICIVADVFPNPLEGNELSITLTKQCVNAVHYSLTDASGRVIIKKTPIALNETIEILKGKALASGIYIVELTSNYAKSEYKVVVL